MKILEKIHKKIISFRHKRKLDKEAREKFNKANPWNNAERPNSVPDLRDSEE